FERLVRGAVGADADAAVSARDQNVEIAVADRSPNLIEVARGGKGRVGAEHGELPFSGEAGGGGSGGLLGDAHADPARLALGLAGVELADSDGTGNIQAEADYPRIVAIRRKRLPETEARWFHLHLHVFGGVPPVVAVKLWHLGVQFALDLGLILPGVGEKLLDGNLACFIYAEFRQRFI